ncbi:carbohydrate ABC transporter permease [Paenibacillus rhizophilus]|uniref:Carbohydrate ABC transporter permease n=1 Tax=Paenibacillus rhizophilus TaxID=1850366 RepID=A0A3N9P2G4_9BACL|nr:carbohydrate ABC transporter permease [Paenibacillus rhizophilus]RQW09667.1 carbohydrate ABC transporter permease [Paenibacillus rhizophilus]
MVEQKNRFADFIIYSILAFACVATILPILHVFNLSLTSASEVHKSNLLLWPKEITFQAYKYLFSTNALVKSFYITAFITIVGTLLNLILTIAGAYALSKPELPGYKGFMVYIVIPMMFNAGMIPSYLLIKNMGLLNSLWALILTGAVSAFNLILMRNFIMGLPGSLEEAAKIDGCSEWTVLFRILIPISKPAIATIGLFYGVYHWNEFFLGVLYLSDSSKWPLQVLLRTIVFDNNMSNVAALNTLSTAGQAVEPANIQAASIIFAALPVLVVYPFLQRYFVKGMVLGAVKG